MSTRVALIFCRCGTNIADHVDLEELARWAAGVATIDVVETADFLCSPAGRDSLRQRLQELQPTAVVIAACSPKMHEETFRAVAADAGVNPGRVLLANIREQAAWVTPDRVAATRKAIALIRAAVARAEFSDDLEVRTMPADTDILIIGGGVAGIEAALTAATAGRQVYLIERDIALGGQVARTESVAPQMECSPCLLAPRLAAVAEHENIHVVTHAEVTAVLGFYGNFTVRVTRHPTYVNSRCIGCGECFAACPVSVPDPSWRRQGASRAVRTLYPGSVPAMAAIDPTVCRHFTTGDCDACRAACPFDAIDFADPGEALEFQVGALILATGFEPLPAPDQFGHSNIPDVLTLSEFECRISANGPTGGVLQTAAGATPETIAVIHLEPSPLLELYALKVDAYIEHLLPTAEVLHIHECPMTGTAVDRLQEQHGLRPNFWICRDVLGLRVTATDRLDIRGGELDPIQVDMVLLCGPMGPADGTSELAELLAVDQRDDGFFAAGHPLLQQVNTTVDGIYTAGAAAGFCNVPTAITRARAAAGDAVSRLQPGREIPLESMTSCIDETICAGCKLCLQACPYDAIHYDADARVSRINEAICRGCGTCTAACPSGASRARSFDDRQIYAEIGGLLHD